MTSNTPSPSPTGRSQGPSPAFQQIPVRTEDGARIRAAFQQDFNKIFKPTK